MGIDITTIKKMGDRQKEIIISVPIISEAELIELEKIKNVFLRDFGQVPYQTITRFLHAKRLQYSEIESSIYKFLQ